MQRPSSNLAQTQMRFASTAALLALALLAPHFASAQDGEAPTPIAEASDTSGAQEPANTALASKAAASGSQAPLIQALQDLRASIRLKSTQIETAQQQRREAQDDTAAEQLETKLAKLHGEYNDLQGRLSRILSQADESLFVEAPPSVFDPKEKVFGLLKPVFDELEELTANTREIKRLEDNLAVQRERSTEAEKATENIAKLLKEDLDEDTRVAVEEQFAVWKGRATDARAKITSMEFELSNRLSQQRPFIDSAGSFVSKFLRTRGVNLLLGVIAFAAVFFGLGAARSVFSRASKKSDGRALSSRVAALVFRGFSVIAAIGALLFVFNITGDWFLLGISLSFLLGLGWVAIKALPQFVQQIGLVLNMGAVREGEFLMFDDVPWEVATIGFTAELVNERLSGGLQRLPVRELVGRHSRPMGKREELFPCKEGDWVRLDDGTIGKVDYQTPNVVQLVLLGGSQKAYPTGDFLALAPHNMSTNYRVELTFGIDYRHQADCTKLIPETMQASMQTGMETLLGEANLLNVNVEFKEAAASSLDYEVQIDIAGKAAARYEEVERAAARVLVECCNQNGWEIPFQQVTLHQPSS